MNKLLTRNTCTCTCKNEYTCTCTCTYNHNYDLKNEDLKKLQLALYCKHDIHVHVHVHVYVYASFKAIRRNAIQCKDRIWFYLCQLCCISLISFQTLSQHNRHNARLSIMMWTQTQSLMSPRSPSIIKKQEPPCVQNNY